MVSNKKLAEIFNLLESEVEVLKEAALVYQVDKDNQGYKDWCVMYDGIHKEMIGESAVRNWLACIRWIKAQNFSLSATLPLDEHLEIINKKFPKYVVIEETKCNAMKSDAVLFKKQHYNEYCYLEFHKGTGGVSITFFKCDWSDFEKIETEFLEGFSFAVKDKSETFVIINTLV